jgi:hypothetical protein
MNDVLDRPTLGQVEKNAVHIRDMDLALDYPVVSGWWTIHGFPVLPMGIFLPGLGFVAEQHGEAVAASWLFVANGTAGGIGLIEFTTTNPGILSQRSHLAAVKALYVHLEAKALALKCSSVMSFVAVNGGEQHIMDKMGYENVGKVPHHIYGKALCR